MSIAILLGLKGVIIRNGRTQINVLVRSWQGCTGRRTASGRVKYGTSSFSSLLGPIISKGNRISGYEAAPWSPWIHIGITAKNMETTTSKQGIYQGYGR